MKKVIVYHDTEGLAKRARRGRPGETIAYRAKKDWSDDENEKFDEVVDFSTKRKPKIERESEQWLQ